MPSFLSRDYRQEKMMNHIVHNFSFVDLSCNVYIENQEEVITTVASLHDDSVFDQI